VGASLAQPVPKTGPTVDLQYGANYSGATAVSDFMYFVALIAPAPVYIGASPGDTQTAKLISATHKSTKSTFVTTCEFQFAGAGLQESLFDLAPEVRRRESAIKAGTPLPHQLESIVVHGAGVAVVEARGIISNDVRVVNEVRIRFDAHGQPSFVNITLCDVRWAGGHFSPTNEVLAKVNTLTFRRDPGIPKMEITVASLKDKAAGDGMWQSLKGKLEGAAVNFFLPPMVIEKGGNEAMLDFGLALTSGATTYTFPLATNLLANPAPQISLLPAGGQ
jgi:hypothetical protein